MQDNGSNPQPFPVPNHVNIMLMAEAKQMAQKQPGGTKKNPNIKFTNPNTKNYQSNIEYAAKLHKKKGVKTISENMLEGRNAVVCGNGPSLGQPEVLDAIRDRVIAGDLVIACKGAIRFLFEKGINPDYAVTMDPGAHIARPDRKIYKAPSCTHIVASSSDPLVFKYLRSSMPYQKWLESISKKDQKAVLQDDYILWVAGELTFDDTPQEDLHSKVMIFHSATGLKDETKLYKDLFTDDACMGGGYNVTNRAISAAIYMGIDKITLAGVDGGWREDQTFYADGAAMRKGVDMNDMGLVDGPPWMTRPDMLASAVAMAKLIKKDPDRFTTLGDTLPGKLAEKDDAFLDQCASFK